MALIKWASVSLLASCLVSISYAASPNPYSSTNVWKVDPNKFLGVLDTCKSDSTKCISKKMQQLGAKAGAIQFTQAVKDSGTGYLEKFEEKGVVDLGSVFYVRANTNTEYVMLNGSPAIVHTEIDTMSGINKDPLYKTAIRKYKDLEFWGSAAEFVSNKTTAKGIDYTFSYPMLNGCHACENPYNALVQFNFDKNGKFLGKKFVKLVKN